MFANNSLEGKIKHSVESPEIIDSPLRSQPSPCWLLALQRWPDSPNMASIHWDYGTYFGTYDHKVPISTLLSSLTRSDIIWFFWRQPAHRYLLKPNWVSHSMFFGANIPDVMRRFPGESLHHKLSDTRKKTKSLKLVGDFRPTMFCWY